MCLLIARLIGRESLGDGLAIYDDPTISVNGAFPFLPCLVHLRHACTPMLNLHLGQVIIKVDRGTREIAKDDSLADESGSCLFIWEMKNQGSLLGQVFPGPPSFGKRERVSLFVAKLGA